MGSTERPRLSVYRSGQHNYASIIDDSKGVTLISVSDLKMKPVPKKSGGQGWRVYRQKSVGVKLKL